MLTQKNQSLHQNRQIGIGFFLVFFGFLKFPNWHWFFFALVLARIRNWKLAFLVFFGFFWFFLVFFGLSFGQHSKLETGFWVFFWDYLVFLVFLAFDFKV